MKKTTSFLAVTITVSSLLLLFTATPWALAEATLFPEKGDEFFYAVEADGESIGEMRVTRRLQLEDGRETLRVNFESALHVSGFLSDWDLSSIGSVVFHDARLHTLEHTITENGDVSFLRCQHRHGGLKLSFQEGGAPERTFWLSDSAIDATEDGVALFLYSLGEDFAPRQAVFLDTAMLETETFTISYLGREDVHAGARTFHCRKFEAKNNSKTVTSWIAQSDIAPLLVKEVEDSADGVFVTLLRVKEVKSSSTSQPSNNHEDTYEN